MSIVRTKWRDNVLKGTKPIFWSAKVILKNKLAHQFHELFSCHIDRHGRSYVGLVYDHNYTMAFRCNGTSKSFIINEIDNFLSETLEYSHE